MFQDCLVQVFQDALTQLRLLHKLRFIDSSCLLFSQIAPLSFFTVRLSKDAWLLLAIFRSVTAHRRDGIAKFYVEFKWVMGNVDEIGAFVHNFNCFTCMQHTLAFIPIIING